MICSLLQDMKAEVVFWSVVWTAGMSDSGFMIVDREELIDSAALDHETRGRIHEKIGMIDDVVGGTVKRLLGEV
jgi:hypothetical protein